MDNPSNDCVIAGLLQLSHVHLQQQQQLGSSSAAAAAANSQRSNQVSR
jgi:hypothetical protein